MNSADVIGSFNVRKSRLKEKFAMLTDSDLVFEEGKEQELFGHLLVKLGKSKEELHNIIREL